MLSTLIDTTAYGTFTYGAYDLWGRGVAAFVLGVCLLLVSYSLANSNFGLARKAIDSVRGPASPEEVKAARDQVVLTNEELTKRLNEGYASVDTPHA